MVTDLNCTSLGTSFGQNIQRQLQTKVEKSFFRQKFCSQESGNTSFSFSRKMQNSFLCPKEKIAQIYDGCRDFDFFAGLPDFGVL
jgi:hypothetical protein